MFERFTGDARTIVIHAQQHARRLGHHYIGCEHLLLAASSSDQIAGAVLRGHGVTPDRVEEEIVRRVGLGGGAGLFADIDGDALASIGIDLDAVRARIEASFGPDALTRAGQRLDGRPRLRLDPRRAIPARLRRAWRRRRRTRGLRRALPPAARPAPATGHYHAAGAVPRGHIPFTRGAKTVLAGAVREAQARHDPHIGIEHLALGLTSVNSGLVPRILRSLGAPGQPLRAAILDHYRQAG